MSKYNHYAKKLDEITRDSVKRIKEAETAHKEKYNALQAYNGRKLTIEEQAAKMKLESEYQAAKDALFKAKRDIPYETERELEKMRKSLAKDLENDFTADPTRCDASTIELLKSGILKPNEYKNLISKAKSEDNGTMARVIADYADKALKENGLNYSNEDAQTMRYAINEGRESAADPYLQTYDTLTNVAIRTCNNTGIESFYNEVSSDLVTNF
jgi:hypothetical protein